MTAVLDTILGSAAGATAAGRGWILGRHADGLEVLAAVGVDDLVGAVVAPAGTAGYVPTCVVMSWTRPRDSSFGEAKRDGAA